MDHELVPENRSSEDANILPNTSIYLKAVNYLNLKLRQIYRIKRICNLSVRKIEDGVVYHDCKDSGPLCWKLKTLWWWFFLFS